MALAAQPQIHFPPQSKSHEPSWDENIVPALRQRLQNESQMLTKRLSTHSISASAAADLANSTISSHARYSTTDTHSSYSNSSKPSAIPRPSSEAVPSKRRQRTNSTPFSSSIPVPSTIDRPTRIPKVSSKGGSVSSHGHHPYKPSNLGAGSVNGSGSLNSRGGKGVVKGRAEYMEPPSPSVSLDQRSDTGSSRGRNAAGLTTGGRNYIPNEEAPFPNSASTSTEFHYEQTRLMHSPNIHATRLGHGRYATTGSSMDESARPSIDEEVAAGSGSGGEPERPFEHWYRGEAARNGGVGELKIGKAEMLDIAQFGHTKTRIGGVEDFRKIGMSTTGGLRWRAGSFDGKRESWIMDEAAYGLGKVIDESPLTDLEGDEYTTEGERNYPYPSTSTFGIVNGTASIGIPGAGSKVQESTYVDGGTTMSTTPTGISSVPAGPYSSRRGTITNGNGAPVSPGQTPQSQQTPPASRIATANGRHPSSPLSAGSKIPLGTNNGASTKSSLLGKPASKNGKGKGKSGIPKQRSKNLSAADQAAQQENGAEEEEQDGVEKIPFRNPPTKGNWDDIVLPAVTKKMGIEGYGLKSEEGNILEVSEEVRKRMSAIQPPVPGLFGYDSSKYRPARPEEDINMAELGVSQPSPPGTPKVSTSPFPPTNSGRNSPLAFSHYQENLPPPSEKNARGKSVPAITVSPPSAEEHARRRKQLEKEEKGAGCCGCVIM